jgi:membrane protein YdbS with pleckstrin-like domain
MENPAVPAMPAIALPEGISLTTVFSVLFALIFLFWLVYTLIVIYHWMRHAPDSWISVPAVAVHLFVSGWLIFYATSGLH